MRMHEHTADHGKSKIDERTHLLRCGHKVANPTQAHYCRLIGLDTALQGDVDPYASVPTSLPLESQEAMLFFYGTHRIIEEVQYLVIRQLSAAITGLLAGNTMAVIPLRFSATLLEQGAHVLKGLKQMPPSLFASFRGQLSPASGAESESFRVLEVMAGTRLDTQHVTLKGRSFNYLEYLSDGSKSTNLLTTRIEETAKQPNLLQALSHWKEESSRAEIAQAVDDFLKQFKQLKETHIDVTSFQLGDAKETTGGLASLQQLKEILSRCPQLPETSNPNKGENT